jgi:para-nitrobenzyl esterase
MLRRALLFSLLTACGSPSTGDAGADASTDAPAVPPPRVTLPEGEVVGLRGPGYVSYLGIPYAEPPIGDRRFAPPTARAPWTEPIGPVRTPVTCPQTALGIAGGEEDCLIVNVHVPDPAPTNAPVIVWIHGGAFLVNSGVGLDRSTLGDFLARDQDVVVVSMNYRLGPFGFFRHPGIAEGNQGILDQQLALEWVRDHVALFGGDPGRVTLVGESAGGVSVCLHLIAPGSRGLFQRAITQSGLCDSELSTIAEAESAGADLVRSAGCEGAGDVAACMRAATTDDLFMAAGDAADLTVLLTGTSNRPFWPLVDGTVLPRSFRDAVTAGDFANVPTILGWNRDEGTLFVGLAEMAGSVADMAAYDRAVDAFATREGIDPAALRAAYPVASYPDPGAAIADLVGDAELICPSRRAALLLSGAGVDLHVYRFEHDQARFQLTLPRDLGAFHSAEIQFVFGHPVGATRFEGAQVALHEAMQGAWGAFARGEPLRADWMGFGAAESALVFDEAITTTTAPNQTDCTIWE